jgi:uncharacterized protein (DUF433 family)
MTQDHHQRIVCDPHILVGKPVIRDTRIPVSLILNLLAHNYTVGQVIEAYPPLTIDDIQAALEYAEEIIGRERVVAITHA